MLEQLILKICSLSCKFNQCSLTATQQYTLVTSNLTTAFILIGNNNETGYHHEVAGKALLSVQQSKLNICFIAQWASASQKSTWTRNIMIIINGS